VLDTFPMTASGKLDRNGLPAPAPGEPGGAQLPRTLVEALLADVFAEVLGLAAVGVDDNFFELGGNSLQAMRLLARLRDTLAVEADVTVVFQTPTVATLAESLRAEHGLSDESLDEDGELAELARLSDDEVAVLLATEETGRSEEIP
jgi:acyl carrier protein